MADVLSSYAPARTPLFELKGGAAVEMRMRGTGGATIQLRISPGIGNTFCAVLRKIRTRVSDGSGDHPCSVEKQKPDPSSIQS